MMHEAINTLKDRIGSSQIAIQNYVLSDRCAQGGGQDEPRSKVNHLKNNEEKEVKRMESLIASLSQKELDELNHDRHERKPVRIASSP